MEVLCKVNQTTLHHILASFVLFHSVRPQKTLVKLAAMCRMRLLKLIKYACDLLPLQLQGGCMNAGQYNAMSTLATK